jgi:septum formation protein
MSIILASSSPRRRELLSQAGIDFEIMVPDTDEQLRTGESPLATAERLACEKAAVIVPRAPTKIVLAADTIVVCEDRILGKPQSEGEARRMLASLSGSEHHVLTGVCLQRQTPPVKVSWVCDSRVRFRTLDADTISQYMERVCVMDKAGAYAVQEHGEMIVESVEGLLSNVIGLPIEEVAAELAKLEATA